MGEAGSRADISQEGVESVDAEIIVRFVARNICSTEDLAKTTLEELVHYLVKEEGLFGIVEDDPQIVSIVEISNRLLETKP